MAESTTNLFSLPNEILLNILSTFRTPELLPFATTCKQIHCIILRILHHRIQIAAGLAGHCLYLECYAPAIKWSAAKLFCLPIGTDGLQELLADIHNESTHIGQGKRIRDLYTRFRPQAQEPDPVVARPPPRNRPGDIPGSRTFIPRNAASETLPPEDVVTETVTIDAHDLFSQLSTTSYFGKRDRLRGLLFSTQEVSDGTIRVWRDWLARQCERKSWTDGEAVVVHHGGTDGKGKDRADSVTEIMDPTKDPSILWTNTRDDHVGIKFRVLQRKWRSDAPIVIDSDLEVPVSYQVQYEAVYVRTSHLLLKLEEAQKQLDNHTGKAIVFGSFYDPQLREVNTGGGQVRW